MQWQGYGNTQNSKIQKGSCTLLEIAQCSFHLWKASYSADACYTMPERQA